MKKTVVILMILTIATKFIGFGREVILSYFYGASSTSDAYLIALTIPTVIFAFIGVGLKTTYIPIYSSILEEKGTEQANRFTNNVINLLIIFCTIIVVFVVLYTSPIVKLFASGFEGETLILAVNLTQICVFSVYFIGIVYILEGYLQLKKNFVVPALIGIPTNLFLIISIILSSKTDTLLLGYGKILAVIAQLIFLIPFLYKVNYKYNIFLDIKDTNVKKMFYLTLPVMFGTSVNQINKLIDRTIASQIAVGGISSLNYANRLISFVQSIFVMSLATVLYAAISKMAAEGNMDALKKSVAEAISGINLLVIPTTIGALVLAEPVVTLLFGRGAFDYQAILMTSDALFFYSIGMIGYGLSEVVSRAFYSLQDTKTPMLYAAISMAINIVLNIVLSYFLGISGLALATSISSIVCTILLFVSLRRKIGPFGMKNISISFFKILLASLMMGIIVKLLFDYLSIHVLSQNLSLIVSVVVGAAIYFIVIYFMRITEVDIFIKAIKRKLKRV